MQRSYTATVAEPSRGSVTVALSGAVFSWGLARFEPGFNGTRDGERLRFTVKMGDGRGVAELVDGTTELVWDGTASATLAGSNITGALNGHISVIVAGDPWDGIAECEATDHKIDFVRR